MNNTSNTYEGWTNYQTWTVYLWVKNDRGNYEHWREQAEIALEDAVDSNQGTIDGTIREAATRLLALRARGEIEAGSPELGATLYSELLSSALSAVDWQEVAENLLQDFEPTPEDGAGDKADPATDEETKAFEAIKRERQAYQGKPLFDFGKTVATPGALEAIAGSDILSAFSRHVNGDWGDVCREDWEENELSLREGFRLLSVYRAANGTKFWLITEADRSATTVLLPSEY